MKNRWRWEETGGGLHFLWVDGRMQAALGPTGSTGSAGRKVEGYRLGEVLQLEAEDLEAAKREVERRILPPAYLLAELGEP